MSQATYHNPFREEAIASAYDGWFTTPLGRRVDRLESALIHQLARPRAGESALDVGTGTGHYALALAHQGLHVTGYDSAEAMLRVARHKSVGATGDALPDAADTASPVGPISLASGGSVSWRQGTAEDLPFADGAFDLVLSVTALEFVRDRERTLGEMFRVTAPGGRMVVAVLNANGPWGRTYTRQALQEDTPFRYAHLFTTGEFAAALRRYGQPRWSSSVFFPPGGPGYRFAGLLEWLGQRLCPARGTLLVGRVDR